MRRAEKRTFTPHDDQRLFYRQWPPASPAGRAVVLFHRGHERSGRLQHIVNELGLADFDMFAWDARGHGRSPQLDLTVATRAQVDHLGVLDDYARARSVRAAAA